jgi:hypothetical protein
MQSKEHGWKPSTYRARASSRPYCQNHQPLEQREALFFISNLITAGSVLNSDTVNGTHPFELPDLRP